MRLLPVLVLATAACSGGPPQPTLPDGVAGTELWQERRQELSSLRGAFDPGRPYSLNVTLEMWVERLGMRTRGRGAVAVHPPHGVRMIMLGPGGTTAMDLWICRDAFRFAIPAADLVRRGDASTPPEELRGLPVDFLRWWFLRPLGGRLLASFPEPPAQRFVLKDGVGVVHLLAGPGDPTSIAVRRVTRDDEEIIETRAELCGQVHYNQRSTSIDLDVTCEQVNDNPPPARAFIDPDDPHRSCLPTEPEP